MQLRFDNLLSYGFKTVIFCVILIGKGEDLND